MSDVSAPATPTDSELVTRKILREELGKLESRVDGRIDKLDGRIDKLDGRIDKLDTKVDTHFGALLERIISLEETVRALAAFVRTLPDEFARQARAISEEARGWVKAVDEKYDLPNRVSQLEARSDE
jgi:hypothetical protein